MTSGKLYLLAVLLTGASVVTAAGVGGFVAYRDVERRLELSDGSLGRALTTFSDLPGTLENIAGTEDSDFGREVAPLRSLYPFTPPGDGRLTDEQVVRFLGVKKRLAEIDAEMIADIERRERETGSAGPGNGEPNLGDLLEWNFFTRLDRLREVQARALAEQRMSLDEFRWVHLAIYTATMARGAGDTLQGPAWSGEVAEMTASQAAELERALSDPAVPPEQRAQLAELRGTLQSRGEAMGTLADHVQDDLAAVPAENFAVLDRHQEDLGRYLFAALDLDTIDVMAALDAAGAMPQ